MKQFLYLSQSKQGYVKYPACKHFLHVKYERFLWKFSQEGLKIFAKYIHELNTPEGFSRNEMEPGLCVVRLQKHQFMGLFSKEDISRLNHLLEQSVIELTRQELELQFQESMHL